jgi:hypothetical protein
VGTADGYNFILSKYLLKNLQRKNHLFQTQQYLSIYSTQLPTHKHEVALHNIISFLNINTDRVIYVVCYATANVITGTNLKCAMEQLHPEVQHIPHATEDSSSGTRCYINE